MGYPVVGYEFGNEPDLFITAMNATGNFGLLSSSSRPPITVSAVRHGSKLMSCRRRIAPKLHHTSRQPGPGAQPRTPCACFRRSITDDARNCLPCSCAVLPWQYAADVATFKRLVSSLPPPPSWSRPPLVIAADVDYIPLTGDFLYYELMAAAARVEGVTWDVASWHFCRCCRCSLAVTVCYCDCVRFRWLAVL